MIKRQTSGSVVCPSCGRLVGVGESRCFNCGRFNPGMWGYAPLLNRLGRDLGFTQIVTWGCAALFLLTLLTGGIRSGGGLLSFLSPSSEALLQFGMSGAVPVLAAGRWWTVLSAAWLHGGLLHIFFNLMWVRQLAPPVAEFFGVGRLVIIYTVSSATGFLMTSLMALPPLPQILKGAYFTVGASAPLFGLFGALVVYGRRAGSQTISRFATQNLVILLIFGLVVPLVDNWAHLGGFAGGYVTARLLDPLREETPRHMLLALICLVATALSIAMSLLVPYPTLG